MALACHGMALAWHGTVCHGCSTSFTQLSTVRTHPPLALLQGTADAVRQYAWLFRDIKNRNVEVSRAGIAYLAGLMAEPVWVAAPCSMSWLDARTSAGQLSLCLAGKFNMREHKRLPSFIAAGCR